MISLKKIGIGCLLFIVACAPMKKDPGALISPTLEVKPVTKINEEVVEAFSPNTDARLAVIVPRAIKVREYFPFLDSVVNANDTVVDYPLTEHLLVHANSWIIDTLASLDYYERMQKGSFIYDQREMVVLHQGDTLWIPDNTRAAAIEAQLLHTLIDVNIPEFKLRIIASDTVKYTFSVRVGRNESKYLKTAGRVVSLRTPIGEGNIVRIERNPTFVNPVNGEHYILTKRDDGKYTKMPQIPWLEPAINGIRYGSLIHPTSNPNTLGKAYSNGCVGTAEGEAWIIYYHAPVGTKVRFRYDLTVSDEEGNLIQLKDIYQLEAPKITPVSLQNYTDLSNENSYNLTYRVHIDHSLHRCF